MGWIPWNVTGWWLNQPIWKICSSKWESSPNRDEHKKYLSCHHLVINWWTPDFWTINSSIGIRSIGKGFLEVQSLPKKAHFPIPTPPATTFLYTVFIQRNHPQRLPPPSFNFWHRTVFVVCGQATWLRFNVERVLAHRMQYLILLATLNLLVSSSICAPRGSHHALVGDFPHLRGESKKLPICWVDFFQPNELHPRRGFER